MFLCAIEQERKWVSNRSEVLAQVYLGVCSFIGMEESFREMKYCSQGLCLILRHDAGK